MAAPRRSTKPSPSTVTPWTGPLARESDGIRNINPKANHNKYETDESDEWIDVPPVVSKTGSFVASPLSSDYSDDDDDDDDEAAPPRSPSPMDDRHSPDFSPKTYRQSNPSTNAYGLLPPPVNPYRHTSPQANTYSISSPQPPTIPFGFVSPVPTAHTPALIPSSHFSPAGSNANLHTYHNTPGYIPSPYTNSPNHSLHYTATLPSIHSISSSDSVSAAALPHAAAGMTHGRSASPYLYSTPRPGHSPYVPAWISPVASSMNVSLPGSMMMMMTPASPRGAVLQHSGGGGYVPTSSGGGPAY